MIEYREMNGLKGFGFTVYFNKAEPAPGPPLANGAALQTEMTREQLEEMYPNPEPSAT